MERKTYLAHAIGSGKTFAKNKSSVYQGKGYRIDNPKSTGKPGDKYLYFDNKQQADAWLRNQAQIARRFAGHKHPGKSEVDAGRKDETNPYSLVKKRQTSGEGKRVIAELSGSHNPGPLDRKRFGQLRVYPRETGKPAELLNEGKRSDQYINTLYSNSYTIREPGDRDRSMLPGGKRKNSYIESNPSKMSEEYKNNLAYNSKTDNFFGQGTGSGSNVYTFDSKTGNTITVSKDKQTSSAGKSWIENLGDTLNQAWNSVSRTAGEVFDSGKRAVGDLVSNALTTLDDISWSIDKTVSGLVDKVTGQSYLDKAARKDAWADSAQEWVDHYNDLLRVRDPNGVQMVNPAGRVYNATPIKEAYRPLYSSERDYNAKEAQQYRDEADEQRRLYRENSVAGRLGAAADAAGKWIGDTANNVGTAVGNAVDAAGKWIGDTANNVGTAVGNAVSDVRNGMQTSAVNNANALRRMTGSTGESSNMDDLFSNRKTEVQFAHPDDASIKFIRGGNGDLIPRGWNSQGESEGFFNPEYDYMGQDSEFRPIDSLFSTSNGRTAPTPGQTNTTMPRSPAQVRSAYEAASRAYEQAIQRGASEAEIMELYNQARSLGAQYENMI